MSRGIRRAAGVVAVCATLLTGCVDGQWTGDSADPSVVVIGDSITYFSERNYGGSERWITDELVAGGAYGFVTGWIGLKVSTGYALTWNQPNQQGVVPDVLLLALGTNDMRILPGESEPRVDVEDARLELRAWLAEVPDACVRLIGVAESVFGWGLDISGPGWNAMLAEEAALHPNAAYVPWVPDLAWVSGGLDPHLTLPGRDAYRALIVAEALECAGL